VRSKEPPKRFAALIRVSTERQEKEGESLHTQRAGLLRTVADLGGTIIEFYGGKESATAGHEKKEVGRLLADASRAKWDAVIVTDADRWSRHDRASDDGLEVLLDNGIRFYVGSTEYALDDPSARMQLGIHAVIGGFQASNQNKKSIENRIARARRGWAASGKLPFGRTFDRNNQVQNGWGVDRAKQAIIEDVARRYLTGTSMPKLAAEYGMNHSSLHKTLTKRCGDQWVQRFRSKKLNIEVKVPTAVPRLLPQETVDAVLAKVAANKTYTHGKIKNAYLLSRVVFCQGCGYAMFGQTNQGRGGHRYYRHAHQKRDRPCACRDLWVRADDLEQAVLAQLFETFGNPAAVERAIERAVPNLDAARQMQDRATGLEGFIEKETQGRKGVLRLVSKGMVTDSEAEEQLRDSQARIDEWQRERDQLRISITNAPTAVEVRAVARSVAGSFRRLPKAEILLRNSIDLANSHPARMTDEEKRDLVQRVFAGKTTEGARAGVYVEWLDGKKENGRRYVIKGLITGVGTLRAGETSDAAEDPEFTMTGDRQGEVVDLTKCAWHSPGTGRAARRTFEPTRPPSA
jgi:DNA invertase Pin-like site-specific DNA recombinase